MLPHLECEAAYKERTSRVCGLELSSGSGASVHMPRDLVVDAVKGLSLHSCDTANAEADNEFVHNVDVAAYVVPREYLHSQDAFLQLGTPGAEAALVEYLWGPGPGARVPYGVASYGASICNCLGEKLSYSLAWPCGRSRHGAPPLPPPTEAGEAPPQPDNSPKGLLDALELSAYFADYAKRLRPLVNGLLDTVGKVGTR